MTRIILAFIFAFGCQVAWTSGNDHTAEKMHDVKAVLVTGASSGIGKQIALTLAEKGFFVYAGARKEKDIKALSALPNTLGVRLDVTIQKDIDAAVDLIEREGRGLFGVVNNAGVFLYGPLIEMSERDMQFIMDVNVFGPYRITKAFAPLVIKSQGRITTIGSIAGIFSGSLFGPYGISKHAMEAFSEALSQEMAKFDVLVSIVEPGNFKSDIMKNMKRRLEKQKGDTGATLYEDEIARIGSFTQADRSRHKAPLPVANAVLHFLTNDTPKFRYMVTPNQSEAEYTIRRSLKKAIELNQDHAFSLSRESLAKLLDNVVAEANK